MSEEVNVLSRTQMIVVNPTTRSVAVINMGSQGPAGVPGQDGADGADGAPGTPGAPGAAGATGAGNYARYVWKAASLSANPGNGFVGVNNATPGAATGMWIGSRDSDNIDWSVQFLALNYGDFIFVRSRTDPLAWKTFRVTAPPQVGGAISIQTDSLSAQGAEPVDNDPVTVTIYQFPIPVVSDGGFGTWASVWKWQNATATAPVPSGEIGHSLSNPGNAGSLWIHSTDIYTQSWTTLLQAMAAGDRIALRAVNDPTRHYLYNVTGAPTVQAGSNISIPVTPTPSVPQGNEPPDDTEVYVTFQKAPSLDDLSNVSAPSASDGQVLRYTAATGLWTPGAGGGGTGLPPGGSIYNLLVKASSADGDAVWSSAPQVSSLTTDILAIRDPVGTSIPRLTFYNGDGNNGTDSNPYDYWWQLLADKLQLFSSRYNSKQVASFKRLSNTDIEFGLSNWVFSDNDDGYLRIFNGTDRTDSEAYFSSTGAFFAKGNITTPGAVIGQWYTESPYFQSAAGTPLGVRSTEYVNVQGNGPLGSNYVGVNVGNQYGVGNGPTVSLYAYPNGNQYYQRQLTLNKVGGGGECGMAFINNVTGNIGCFQLHNDGSPYIGFLNSANSAYIKAYASAFTVNSSRRFKSEIKRFGSKSGIFALAIVNKVRPVRYRDLQHEMAMEVLAPKPDGTPQECVEVEPRYRFGLIAEEVEEVAPELVSHTPDHGPGIDLSGLVGVLWQAVRELSDRVRELEGAHT